MVYKFGKYLRILISFSFTISHLLLFQPEHRREDFSLLMQSPYFPHEDHIHNEKPTSTTRAGTVANINSATQTSTTTTS